MATEASKKVELEPGSDSAPPAKRRALLKYDYTSDEKKYMNGLMAPNRWKSLTGALSGRAIRIPDVTSGYPKIKLAPVGNDAAGTEVWYDMKSSGGARDALNFVHKFLVAIPSTNTIVEPDWWRMIHSNPKLDGIGFHSMPIMVPSAKIESDSFMLEFLDNFKREIFKAIDIGMTAEPDYLLMGVSAEVFFDGVKGCEAFLNEIRDYCGLDIASANDGMKAALDKFKARKIAVITPYPVIMDKATVKFFTDLGCEVAAIHGLKAGSVVDIAHVTEAMAEPIIRELAAIPGVEAVVQCGTNLSMIRLMDRLETELGVAMIPINAVVLWFALRELGINEPMYGCCRLCREF